MLPPATVRIATEVAADPPRVSVVMAVHNGERYLAEAVQSILGQSFRHFELLIVNDGSVDRTREILLSFRDPRIRVFHNETRLGLPRSLNRGLRASRGEFVARQDADDLSEPIRFARQVSYLERNPHVALLGTWYAEIDAQGRDLGRRRLPCDDYALRWALLFYCPFVHSSVMFRRQEVVESAGLYSEDYPTSQDYEFWLRIAARFEVANVPQVLVRLRTHAWSLSSREGRTAARGHRLRVERMAKLLDWEPVPGADIDARFGALTALATGYVPRDLQVPSPGAAVNDLLQLLARFIADSELHRSAAARLARQVRTACARALLVLGARQVVARPAEAARLVWMALAVRTARATVAETARTRG